MVHIPNQHSVKLVDRILWFDGTTTVPSDDISAAILSGVSTANLHVDILTPELQQFNKFTPKHKQITVKSGLLPLSQEWTIPTEYMNLDVLQFLLNHRLPDDLSDDECLIRIRRLQDEMVLFEQFNLIPVLRVLIFIINTLNANNVIWGVGRGSSVSSYVLYLIGVHDIDSVKYNLDITDFLRPTK